LSPLRNADDQALLVLYLDSIANLPATRGRWPATLKVKAAAGGRHAATGAIACGCRHPLIDERLVLVAANPTNDDLVLSVVDGDTGGAVGVASLELTQLLSVEGRVLANHSLQLMTKAGRKAAATTIQFRKEGHRAQNIDKKNVTIHAQVYGLDVYLLGLKPIFPARQNFPFACTKSKAFFFLFS
jgi:hypothetical protein